jgi:2,4-dienoyl-CoA reductase-like NADH-dependent reductase (Old Yellow Enzyme family)/thioredoxin reductase
MKKYPNLFKPITIGSLTLRNRIEVAPMGYYGTPEGYLTPASSAFYEMRAKGGAAVVTLGESLVDSKTGKAHDRIIPLDDPGVLPSLIDTTDAIKQHGARASIELIHAGQRSNPNYTEDRKVYGPSAGDCIYGGPILEMEESLIEKIVEAFGDAAEMAKLSGVDMCMVHGGHGWLLAQFLSPINNHRKDRFGGSLENRARISLMAVDNIRSKCGPDFPIEFRMSGSEFLDGGLTLEEAVEFAKLLDGKVDLIHVSATSFHDSDAGLRMFPSMFLPRGCNVFLAEAIKKAVKTPVVTVGALSDPAHMEEIIASGKADMVALARAAIADPFLPEKARKGNAEDITPCLRCNVCISASFVPYIKYPTLTTRCVVNPQTGREYESRFVQPTTGWKGVMIAGGGPGGMQAAVTAADRGHEVLLYEKTDSLGGQLKYARHVAFKTDLEKFMNCLIRRVSDRAIKVRFNTEVTPELVHDVHPDILIAAVGAEAIKPDLPGIDNKKVVMVQDAHKDTVTIGQKVVIIGGGLTGCEEGLHLAHQGRDVTVVEMMERAARDAPYLHWRALMLELDRERRIDLKTNVTCKSITDKGVLGVDENGEGKLFEADTVIIAVGFKSLSEQVESLRECAPDFAVIGDCLKPKTVMEAVHMGYFAAMNI